MSYSGTVRCSYCYEKGHNRLGCPKRRKDALKNPDSYEGKKWHREQAQRKQQIENRTCSYCDGPKHNRRGCKQLKQDKALVKARQEKFVGDFYERMKSLGLGPGALVKVPRGYRTHSDPDSLWSKGTLEMVVAPAWDEVDFTLQDTDLSKSWRGRDRVVFRTRVVSTFGYTAEDESSYYGPPKHNEKSVLKVHQLMEIMPDVFSMLPGQINEELLKNQPGETIELIAPVAVSVAPPEVTDLTNTIVQVFNFEPEPRSDRWDKQRLPLASQAWAQILPEEHKAAIDVAEPSRWA